MVGEIFSLDTNFGHLINYRKSQSKVKTPRNVEKYLSNLILLNDARLQNAQILKLPLYNCDKND